MLLGENIKKIRTEKGITQGELEKLSGIKINQISKIERGESDPKASTIRKIMKALDCDANSIMMDKEDLEINEDLERFIRDMRKIKQEDKIVIMKVIEKFKFMSYVEEIERLKGNELAAMVGVATEEEIKELKGDKRSKMEVILEERL